MTNNQDPEYLEPMRLLLGQAALDAIVAEGWRLITEKDFGTLCDAYVMEALRRG